MLRVKPGVEFTIIAPGGFRILSALEYCTRALNTDLTITSACDGTHSGPNDPHHRGEAYDVRSHDLRAEVKRQVINEISNALGTKKFYAFLEAEGTANEHIHIQVRKGTTYA